MTTRTGREAPVVPLEAWTTWGQGTLEPMPRPECLSRLAQSRVGRVAYNDPDGPVVLPVNARVVGTEVLLRTRPGSRLAEALRDAPASFQVDAFDSYQQVGWSVLLRGHATWAEEDDLPAYESERPAPWAEGDRTTVIRIIAGEITGRILRP